MTVPKTKLLIYADVKALLYASIYLDFNHLNLNRYVSNYVHSQLILTRSNTFGYLVRFLKIFNHRHTANIHTLAALAKTVNAFLIKSQHHYFFQATF